MMKHLFRVTIPMSLSDYYLAIQNGSVAIIVWLLNLLNNIPYIMTLIFNRVHNYVAIISPGLKITRVQHCFIRLYF